MNHPPSSLFPIAIVEDRYQGAYSGGDWLAIGKATVMESGRSRIDFILNDGPSGGDVDAAIFWADAPDWIKCGDTPDSAVQSLIDSYTT